MCSKGKKIMTLNLLEIKPPDKLSEMRKKVL